MDKLKRYEELIDRLIAWRELIESENGADAIHVELRNIIDSLKDLSGGQMEWYRGHPLYPRVMDDREYVDYCNSTEKVIMGRMKMIRFMPFSGSDTATITIGALSLINNDDFKIVIGADNGSEETESFCEGERKDVSEVQEADE